jgi:hypothetical protein
LLISLKPPFPLSCPSTRSPSHNQQRGKEKGGSSLLLPGDLIGHQNPPVSPHCIHLPYIYHTLTYFTPPTKDSTVNGTNSVTHMSSSESSTRTRTNRNKTKRTIHTSPPSAHSQTHPAPPFSSTDLIRRFSTLNLLSSFTLIHHKDCCCPLWLYSALAVSLHYGIPQALPLALQGEIERS